MEKRRGEKKRKRKVGKRVVKRERGWQKSGNRREREESHSLAFKKKERADFFLLKKKCAES